MRVRAQVRRGSCIWREAGSNMLGVWGAPEPLPEVRSFSTKVLRQNSNIYYANRPLGRFTCLTLLGLSSCVTLLFKFAFVSQQTDTARTTTLIPLTTPVGHPRRLRPQRPGPGRRSRAVPIQRRQEHLLLLSK